MIIEEAVYLQHHGVKGQRWGIRNKKARIARQTRRQQRQVDITRRVASGKGGFWDKTRIAARTPLIDLATEGLQGTAEEQLRTAQRYQRDIRQGRRKTRSLLLKMQGIHYNSLNFSIPKG